MFSKAAVLEAMKITSEPGVTDHMDRFNWREALLEHLYNLHTGIVTPGPRVRCLGTTTRRKCKV